MYLNISNSSIDDRKFIQKPQFLYGNFVEKAGEINAYDFVILEKVVCCYPDYKSLLALTLKKCNKTIALTFSLRGPISKIIGQFTKIHMYFKKNPFRTYIHSPGDIERFILSNGFKTVHKKISFPWHVQVYDKV